MARSMAFGKSTILTAHPCTFFGDAPASLTDVFGGDMRILTIPRSYR
jgi:hypothetical protein